VQRTRDNAVNESPAAQGRNVATEFAESDRQSTTALPSLESDIAERVVQPPTSVNEKEAAQLTGSADPDLTETGSLQSNATE